MKTIIGLYPQRQLVLASDTDTDADLRARFGLGDAEFSRVPFVDTEQPEDVPGKVWMPDHEWSAEAVTRTWNQHDAQPPSAAELMTAARSAMAAILDALPLADRMTLQPLRVACEHALNLGQVDLALYTVNNASIPAELESVRAQILALFPTQ